MAEDEYYDVMFNRDIDDTGSNMSGVDRVFLYYTVPPNILPTIDLMALCTALLTVFGFFTNCIAIGMLSGHVFHRMSFSVLLKILCMYNVVVLFLGSVRYQSFYLDHRTHVANTDRRYFCTYLLWFVLVFRHARTASVMLLLYNRINAQSEPDIFIKYVDAIRFPILGNTLFLLVSTVYVSRYIDNLDRQTMEFNRTECTFAFMAPYRKQDDLTADDMVSNMPIFEHGTILLMVIILLIKVVRKSRRKSNPEVASDSTTSSPPLQRDLADLNSKNLSLRKLRVASNIAKFSVLPTPGVMEIKDILFPMTAYNVQERDVAVTVMTVTIVILNSLTSGLRDAADSFILTDMISVTTSATMAFRVRTFLDLTFFTYMATMFFIMCLTCTYFRQLAFNILYSVHSDSSIGPSSTTMVNPMPLGSLLCIDPMESPPGDRRVNAMLPPVALDEQIVATTSVWSLDKAYFLSNTRQHAVVEKF